MMRAWTARDYRTTPARPRGKNGPENRAAREMHPSCANYSTRYSTRSQMAERQKIALQPVTSSFFPPSISLTLLALNFVSSEGL